MRLTRYTLNSVSNFTIAVDAEDDLAENSADSTNYVVAAGAVV